MTHTPQDALLAAVLRALDAERDESGKIIDPDPVRADIEKIIAHGTAAKHEEASSQVSIFTGRTPSQGGSIPKFAEEDTQAAQHLGNFYAHLLDSLELAGKNVDLMADALSNDIEEYGYRLVRGDDGWHAEQGDYEEFVEPGFTGQSQDKRGYRICYKDGKRVSCGHRDKGVMSAQRVAARKERQPDLGKLNDRLKVHAASHPINRHEMARANLALNLLKRHHGELAAHRLEELADGLERALGAVPEQRKAMVSKQLAMLHAMIGMVGEKAKQPEPASGKPTISETKPSPESRWNDLAKLLPKVNVDFIPRSGDIVGSIGGGWSAPGKYKFIRLSRDGKTVTIRPTNLSAEQKAVAKKKPHAYDREVPANTITNEEFSFIAARLGRNYEAARSGNEFGNNILDETERDMKALGRELPKSDATPADPGRGGAGEGGSSKPEDAPKPPEPGYTGTDPLGREWRDGKLVAKGEEAKGDFALTPVIAKGYHDNSLRQARLEATDARSTYAVSKDIVERTDAGSRTYLQDYTMQAINKLRSQLPSLKDDAERAEDHYQLLRKGFLANPARHETAILEQLEDTPNGLTADDAGYLVGLPSGDADALLRQLATDGEIYAHKGVSPSGTVYSLAKKKPRNYAPVQKDDDTKQASKDATAPLESQSQPQPSTGGLEDLPSQVRSTVTWAANKIKDRHDAIAQGKMLDQKLRGEGRYEQEVRDKTPPSRDAEAKLREFISLASDNGIDPRKVMGELGLTEEHLADYPDLAQQGNNPTAPEPPEAIDTRMKSLDPRAYAEALKAMSPQDRQAYLERKKAAAVEGQKRAKAGGEIGPNGEWYPGGAYIATTEMPKMVRQRLEQSASGSVQVSPGNFEVPEAGKLAIFHILGPGVALDQKTMELNDAGVTYYGGDREVLQGLLDRYKKGERWVQANDFPSLASAADASRLLVAGKPVPGEMLKHLAPAIRERLEKFKPKAAAVAAHQGDAPAPQPAPAPAPVEKKPEPARVEEKPTPSGGGGTPTPQGDFSQTEREAADFISKIGTPLSGKPGWYHQTLYRLYTNDDVADLVIKHKDLDNKIFDAKTLDDWATVADRAEQAGFPPTLIKATRAVVEHLGPKSTVSTRKVNTRHGEKTVHSYPAPKKFWDFWKTADKSKLPSNVSPQKDQLTGEWEVAIWGTDEKDVYKSLDQLSSLGLARHYKPAAPSGSTPAQFSEPLADLLASLPPAGYRSVLLSLPAGTRRAYLSHKRKSAVRKFAESRR